MENRRLTQDSPPRSADRRSGPTHQRPRHSTGRVAPRGRSSGTRRVDRDRSQQPGWRPGACSPSAEDNRIQGRMAQGDRTHERAWIVRQPGDKVRRKRRLSSQSQANLPGVRSRATGATRPRWHRSRPRHAARSTVGHETVVRRSLGAVPDWRPAWRGTSHRRASISNWPTGQAARTGLAALERHAR